MAKYKVLMIGGIWPATDIKPDTTMEEEIVKEVGAELIVDEGKDEKNIWILLKKLMLSFRGHSM